MLTAHEIDDIIDRLREWLVESNEQLDNPQYETLAQTVRNGASPQTGLLQLAEAFTAMRHEAKLNTKSVRALSERVEQGLGELGQASAQLNKTTEEVQQRGEAETRYLIESLINVDESLEQALATWHRKSDQQNADSAPADDGLAERCQQEFQRLPKWKQIRFKPWQEKIIASIQDWRTPTAAADHSHFASGLEMLKARLQRSLDRLEVTRIDCFGKPFDPNQMRVVATVADAQDEPGTVVEQLRPGYLHNDKVLRHAEVKVVAQ